MEFEVLQKSFDLESQQQANSLAALAASIGGDDGDNDGEEVIVFDEKSADMMKLAIEDYMKERKSLYSEILDEKVKHE